MPRLPERPDIVHLKKQAKELLQSRKDAVPFWLHDVYGHQHDRPRPILAARKLAERPELGEGDLFLACATGDESTLRRAIAENPASVHSLAQNWRCPCCQRMLDMPPLVAITHSALLQLGEFKDRLRRCARMLLDAGADPNQSWLDGSSGDPLSALYGAAGKNHDPELTRLLLEAGANPNDNESLYHSTESFDLTCMRLLLDAGARVEGTNAVHHMLDRDDLDGLKLLLFYVKDVGALTSTIGNPLIWAIRRRRSRAHAEALLGAGVDPHATTSHGVSAYRFALSNGLPEIAEALAEAGAGLDSAEALSIDDQFVAACARADEPGAQRILAEKPDIFRSLSNAQLRQLPQLMESQAMAAVRVMVKVGWPITVQGGDWRASALNLAVFQGNAEMTRFLLEHGAAWTERHGFNDNVRGTLSWASRNNDPERGDWVGCAKALVEHGMPIDRSGQYSEEVADFFAAHEAELHGSSLRTDSV